MHGAFLLLTIASLSKKTLSWNTFLWLHLDYLLMTGSIKKDSILAMKEQYFHHSISPFELSAIEFIKSAFIDNALNWKMICFYNRDNVSKQSDLVVKIYIPFNVRECSLSLTGSCMLPNIHLSYY